MGMTVKMLIEELSECSEDAMVFVFVSDDDTLYGIDSIDAGFEDKTRVDINTDYFGD